MARTRNRGETRQANEEERRLGESLRTELSEWPGVSLKPMFGFWGAWKGKRMFDALPRTRSVGAKNLIGIKFGEVSKKLAARLATDGRVNAGMFGGAVGSWHTFRYSSESDLPDLLEYLAWASEG